MNREIKFRAWDKENEEMYDVAMIDVETKVKIADLSKDNLQGE